MHIFVIEQPLSICRLPAGREVVIPPNAEFFSLTRTEDEVSVVCATGEEPDGARCNGPWRALAVEGPLDFSLVGVLAALAVPLATAGISIFAISTFDTDYVLVREERLGDAVASLRSEGHTVGSVRTPASGTRRSPAQE